MTRLFLSAVAYDRFGTRLARDGVEPLLLDRDDTIALLDGSPVDPGGAEPEIAWCTSDLFLEGGPLASFYRLLRDSPSLRWFHTAAAGYDGPIFSELARRGVRICNTHANSIPIAEFVVRSVLDHFQRADRWGDRQQAKRWELHEFREVQDSTWLIVGLGGIGSAVASRAKAFGATVIGSRRNPTGEEPVDRVVAPSHLPEVIGEADVVVISAPASSETLRLVDASFLASMKPTSVLVNVSRGSLLDENALIASLDRGVPEVAVLDVFDVEPLPGESPLWSHPSVVVTPHNAALGLGRYGRQADLFVENLDRYLDGRVLLNEVTEAAKG
jgi:phosphoglycerate dehydrogenase-like enzyme